MPLHTTYTGTQTFENNACLEEDELANALCKAVRVWPTAALPQYSWSGLKREEEEKKKKEKIYMYECKYVSGQRPLSRSICRVA
jgi:hypothetical protein